ncbi:MAG: undecaprenyl-diphosphate phosphatase [Lachnospiraceae bacterium]|jgi:undecaprenyl-diphosphatase|nr:undecaprenyl-diphosphate phosphatase [Lachnospiraceae bacterium]MCI1397799.1 undecaprenyl-diphosphate phosphatase [Lachnospiraceae bacterium]MCI1423013.1 undecaprenyl-diphosphate phosphatase [Lachnospiraceae bacterium]MCI1451773.1 undecaprenyl-diphosphate phosphatase [Lachnospiraceae bacterium]MDD5849945.1 undecaprenyl-diphosphate phosphatase [Bacillota bacterium]
MSLNLLKAALFGLVEGVTEWLPVSSTGHMILLNEFVKLDVSEEFWNLFLVVIQFGAILAVILLYWNTIWPLGIKKHRKRTRIVWKKNTLQLWAKTIVACIPAAVVGVLLDDWLDEHLYNWAVVSIMLILVGAAFLVVENREAKKNEPARVQNLDELSYKDAFAIGLFQLVAACLPGTSRSGSTIIGGLVIGVSRTVAAEFTFVLAIPVMAGASLLKMVKYNGALSGDEKLILAVGMVVAFVVSMFIIRFLMNYIRRHDFKVFGWYRIALGAAVILYFALRG